MRIDFQLYIFFFNDTATTEIYTLSLHDALPISHVRLPPLRRGPGPSRRESDPRRGREPLPRVRRDDRRGPPRPRESAQGAQALRGQRVRGRDAPPGAQDAARGDRRARALEDRARGLRRARRRALPAHRAARAASLRPGGHRLGAHAQLRADLTTAMRWGRRWVRARGRRDPFPPTGDGPRAARWSPAATGQRTRAAWSRDPWRVPAGVLVLVAVVEDRKST